MTPSEVLAKYPGLTWRQAQEVAATLDAPPNSIVCHSRRLIYDLDDLVTDTLNAAEKTL